MQMEFIIPGWPVQKPVIPKLIKFSVQQIQ